MKIKAYINIALSLVALLLLPLSGVQAQEQTSQLFKEAQDNLYLSGKATKVAFTSTVYSAENEILGKIQGQIILQGESFRLEYSPIVAVYSNKLLAYHDAENETFTVSEPSEEELLQINPLYFLRSQAKGFKVETLPESKTMQILRFTPPNEEMNIRHLTVSFNRYNKNVQEVNIEATDGAKFMLKVNAQEYIPLKDKSFFVLKHQDFPKSEFVDLR